MKNKEKKNYRDRDRNKEEKNEYKKGACGCVV